MNKKGKYMNHIYFDKTAIYRDKTDKGTKWLFYLTFIRPFMTAVTSILAILLSLAFDAANEEWTTFHTALIILLAVGNIATHFCLSSTKPWGWWIAMVFFSAALAFQVIAFFLSPDSSNLLEIPIGIATLVYLYNRQGIYGIRLKNSKCPVITLPEETDLPSQQG
jgi:uncharacterized membrane protein (DUF2068 family)